MGVLKLCQAPVADLPDWDSSHSPDESQASLTPSWLSIQKGFPKFHTQFLDAPQHSGGNGRDDISSQFLCGPETTHPSSRHKRLSRPSAFAEKNMVNLRLELPAGFNIDRVTQLPLFADGNVKAGHSIGRDINISIANEHSFFRRQKNLEKWGLRHPEQGSASRSAPVNDENDEEQTTQAPDREVVGGDEWPSEIKAKKEWKAQRRQELQKRQEEASLASGVAKVRDPPRNPKFKDPHRSLDRESGEDDNEPQTQADDDAADDDGAEREEQAETGVIETRGDSGSDSVLAKRIAALEAESRKKDEQLKAAMAQMTERANLPVGQPGSRCCQCQGVVTFAADGKCLCPTGDAETRMPPAGCQPGAGDMYKGVQECAHGCREVFWGKERTRKVEDVERDDSAAIAAVEEGPGHKHRKASKPGGIAVQSVEREDVLKRWANSHAGKHAAEVKRVAEVRGDVDSTQANHEEQEHDQALENKAAESKQNETGQAAEHASRDAASRPQDHGQAVEHAATHTLQDGGASSTERPAAGADTILLPDGQMPTRPTMPVHANDSEKL